MNTIPVLGLGGRAIFIGFRSAISVSTLVFPSIKSDSIYVGLDDMLGSNFDSNRLYCLTDGTAECCVILQPADFDEECSCGMPRQFGPWGIDDFLSCYVTEYNDDSEDA
jgi:hypothetical protein